MAKQVPVSASINSMLKFQPIRVVM